MADPYQYDPQFAGQQNAVPQPYYPQVQTPASQMQDYGYLQNQNFIMQSQQTQTQQVLAVAQQNMHNHMQSIMQGTMAAGMAMYSVGKQAHEKMREAQYNDMLLGNGKYVLETSNWRAVAKMTGLMDTSLGQSLKIGGRRPEYLSQAEYGFQLDRAVHHRKEEFLDELMSGGATAAGATLGMYIPGGMAVGMAGGLALDMTIGKVMQPFLAGRKAGREMKQFAEITDFNKGTGQTRLTGDVADKLGRWAHDEDVTNWKYVPIIGDAIDGRLGRETKRTKLIKDMAKEELFKDVDITSFDKLTKHIDKTAEAMDKFAGAMNTTREAVLQMKGTLQRSGMNDAQQNNALENISRLTIGTGIRPEVGIQYHDTFNRAGLQTGYYSNNNPGLQGNFGIAQIAAIRAGQEANIISKLEDPGTLAMANWSQGVAASRTAWGMVANRGGGNVNKAASYYAKKGGGDTALGMLRDRWFKDATDNPIDEFRDYVSRTTDQLGRVGGEKELLANATTRQEAENIRNILDGSDAVMQAGSRVKYKQELYKKSHYEKDESFTGLEAIASRSKLNEAGLVTGSGNPATAGFNRIKLYDSQDRLTEDKNRKLFYNLETLRANSVGWSDGVPLSRHQYRSAKLRDAGVFKALEKDYQLHADGKSSDAELDVSAKATNELLMKHQLANDMEEADTLRRERIRDREGKSHLVESKFNSMRFVGSNKGGTIAFMDELKKSDKSNYNSLSKYKGASNNLYNRGSKYLVELADEYQHADAEKKLKIIEREGFKNIENLDSNSIYYANANSEELDQKTFKQAMFDSLSGHGIYSAVEKDEKVKKNLSDKFGSQNLNSRLKSLDNFSPLAKRFIENNDNSILKNKETRKMMIEGLGTITLDDKLGQRAINAMEQQEDGGRLLLSKLLKAHNTGLTPEQEKARMESLVNSGGDTNLEAIQALTEALKTITKAVGG